MIANKQYQTLKLYAAAGLLICFFGLSGYVYIDSSEKVIDQIVQFDRQELVSNQVTSAENWSVPVATFNRSILQETFLAYCQIAFDSAERVKSFKARSNQSQDRTKFSAQRKTVPSASKEPASSLLIG
ncbi:MAG: hypothetical protein ABJP45_14095 [Cyclobacteriaceae bacterium]